MLRPILLASLVSLGLSSAARAAPAAHVPVPLVADGTTATPVVFAIPGVVPGDPLKARADTARVDAVRIVAPGVVIARVLPDASADPGTVVVSFRGKGAGGKIALDLPVPTQGGLAAAIVPAPPPAGVGPGQPPVTLTLRLPATPQAPAARTLLGAASLGSLGPVTVTGPESAQVEWTPPERAAGSQIAVLGFSDAAAPARVVGVVAMPLLAEASITLSAPADSENTLRLGGQAVGTATASPAGTVAFTLAVDPRDPQATLETTTRDGRVQTQAVELETAAVPGLVFLPGPERRVADPASPSPLLVAQLDARGRPVTDRPPTLSASRGSMGVAQATGVPGIWLAAYTPPDTPGSVTFTAATAGVEIEQKVTLVAAPPRLSLTPASPTLAHDARSLGVTVSGGTGAPALEARGARLGSRPRKTPDGTAFVLSPDADPSPAGIWLLAAPPQGPTGMAPARVTLTGPDTAPEDGPIPLTLRLTDAAGLPVPDAPLTAQAGWSTALDLPDRTDPQGLARIWLTPPASGSGVLSLRAGGLPGGAVLGAVADPLPPSPFAPTTWVSREPAPVAAAAAAVPATATDAPPAAPAGAQPGPAPAVDRSAPSSTTAPTAPEAQASAPATPWLRVGVSAGLGGHDWSQDADDGIAGPESDSDTAGDLPLGLGAAAVGLHAQAWIGGGPLGVDLDLVGQGGEFSGDPARTLRGGLGVQGRLRLGETVGLYGHLGAGTTPGHLVVHEDGDPDAETGVVQRILGGQVGAGVLLQTPRLHVDLGVRELWAPWPVQTQGRLDLGVAPAERIGIDLRMRYAARTMAFEVDGESIDTQDTLAYIGLGVSVLGR